MKKIKITLAALASLAVFSCSLPISQQISPLDNFGTSQNIRPIRGQVSFPEFRAKASIGDIGNKAVVSLLLPPDDPTNPNKTVATGLTDASGNFTINVSFTPVSGQVYILEASKRIGGPGNQVISLRSYLKWDGSAWQGITTPELNINSKTTAIAIIDYYDSSISANDTIGTIISGTESNIGTVSTSLINNVANKVSFTFGIDRDPVRFISHNNGVYFVRREESHNKSYLTANKHCPNCDLQREFLGGLDLSGANLKNANLSFADLSTANLSSANLRSANLSSASLTGANVTNADFSNATWLNSTTICAEGSIGQCIFPDILVNTYTTNSQSEQSLAMDADGDFVITWESSGQDGSSRGIYAQRYTSSGSVNGSEFRVNTYTTGNQRNPSVAMDADGDFVITWESYSQDGSNNGIYAQRYTSTGAVNGAEFQVNTYTTNSQRNPSVAMDGIGDFVIVWQSYGQDASDYGVYAQRYASSGAVNGSEFRVNTFTNGSQRFPAVAMDADGDFVIVWQSYGQDGSYYGSYAQRYTSTGSVNGSEFQVNTYTTNSQINPSVAMDVDGDFVITWGSFNQDGNYSGIYAQRYTSNGSVNGSEFLVNTYTTNNQRVPSVAMDADGDFVITWESYGQDGSSDGIYAQRYTSTGSVNGSEFRVNAYTTSSQVSTSNAMDTVGDFVVTWRSTGQDGSNNGIYLKRYNSSGLSQ